MKWPQVVIPPAGDERESCPSYVLREGDKKNIPTSGVEMGSEILLSPGDSADRLGAGIQCTVLYSWQAMYDARFVCCSIEWYVPYYTNSCQLVRNMWR